MRDQRFIAKHRGGTLNKEEHHQLIIWAIACVKHVLPLLGNDVDQKLYKALEIAKAWTLGEASVGDARNASFEAIAVANENSNPTYILVARAVGHAVATAHMADHSLRAAQYANKAIKSAGNSVEKEREWQESQLPYQIKNLVISALKNLYKKDNV